MPRAEGQRWGRMLSVALRWLVVPRCQPRLFVPSLPHLPHNRLTVSGTHSSGYSAPPLAKNRRPRKLLSHPHGVRNGEETFPMPYWVVSGSSLWGWVPLWLRTRQQACTASCPVSGGQKCGHLGPDNRASAETPKVLGWGGGRAEWAHSAPGEGF